MAIRLESVGTFFCVHHAFVWIMPLLAWLCNLSSGRLGSIGSFWWLFVKCPTKQVLKMTFHIEIGRAKITQLLGDRTVYMEPLAHALSLAHPAMWFTIVATNYCLFAAQRIELLFKIYRFLFSRDRSLLILPGPTAFSFSCGNVSISCTSWLISPAISTRP